MKAQRHELMLEGVAENGEQLWRGATCEHVIAVMWWPQVMYTVLRPCESGADHDLIDPTQPIPVPEQNIIALAARQAAEVLDDHH